MVVLSKPALDHFNLIKTCKPSIPCAFFSSVVPVVDLSKPDCTTQLVKACEEFGFFKVINHDVPMEFMNALENEAVNFFSLPQAEKDKVGPPNPFGYGNRKIGRSGDIGWIEYLLLRSSFSAKSFDTFKEFPDFSCDTVDDYVSAVKNMGCDVLELLADGLKLKQRNVFSKMIMDEESDSVFRLNHYPPCPELQTMSGRDIIGFGEHTDPQIISVLRSNNATGLQIALQDGTWVSVPPDQNSFFIIVGDSMQVMTNGRFKSVRHRVLANSNKSRVSMIYFGAPPLRERIAPLESLMKEGEESHYKEFTWLEYKKSAYASRLADNRLDHFQK